MASAATTHDVDHLRDRVRLYLQVLLVIDLAGYASDGVDLLLGKSSPQLHLAYAILRWLVTALLIGGWSFARYARPSRTVLVALESGLTMGLAFVYVQLASAYIAPVAPQHWPTFALLGIQLLLALRAALVPSPVVRTVVLGLAAVACWLVLARDTLGELHEVVFSGLVFMGAAFVVAAAATSRVIYGLRAQVRDAMRLGQYQLGRKLGEGGMGVVYEATHLMLRRPTAVKLLPLDRAGEQTIARFEREVQQTSRLEHPNSVYIYDYGRTPDGQFYYAMEYLDGVTLEQLVEFDGPIGAARAAHILTQAAHALAEAHAMGLIHRDIKPANIMLCERAQVPDTVKVLDFGLVKAVDQNEVDAHITHANTVVGTPHYLAPESINRPDDVGPAADVYALGAVGFYLVTGREVFPGASVIDVCAKHLNSAPESPSAVLGAAIDADFEALILRCLAKAPADRPADGAALARALEALDLGGWDEDDARRWWRERPARGEPVSPSARTELAIDLDARG